MPKNGMTLKQYPELDSRIKAVGIDLYYCRLIMTTKMRAAQCFVNTGCTLHGPNLCCCFAPIWRLFLIPDICLQSFDLVNCSMFLINRYKGRLHPSNLPKEREASPDDLSGEQLWLLQVECTMLWSLSTTMQIGLQGRRPYLRDVTEQ